MENMTLNVVGGNGTTCRYYISGSIKNGGYELENSAIMMCFINNKTDSPGLISQEIFLPPKTEKRIRLPMEGNSSVHSPCEEIKLDCKILYSEIRIAWF
jgi:hypothetical protein